MVKNSFFQPYTQAQQELERVDAAVDLFDEALRRRCVPLLDNPGDSPVTRTIRP